MKLLHYPDLKYTADRDVPCAVCRVTIRQGEQCCRANAASLDEWQHPSHLAPCPLCDVLGSHRAGCPAASSPEGDA